MKKFLLTSLFLACICLAGYSSEITEDYFDIATNYCVEGNYREAINYLDKILLIEPNNKNIQDLRNGLRSILRGENSSFILSKSSAVKQSVDARKKGNKQGELNALTSGNDYWAYYFLGEYYKRNKEYSQAISSFVKSVNSKPSLVECYLEIAVCYYAMGNYSQSITYLNQYLKINEKDDFAYSLRARCNSNLGNNDSALSDIIVAEAIENSTDYKFLEGKILFNMHNYQKALDKLNSISGEIQTAEFYKYLGLAQAELGNKTDAIINLEKSIILFDDDKAVNKKYNELKTGMVHE